MSRHRNIRTMNISDEYEGYEDVYGHSVEEDYCISPSDAAEFLYDREGSKGQQKISSFLKTDEDIAEEDESVADKIASLDECDQARLESCIDQIKSTLGLNIPKQELVDIILKNKFDVEVSLNEILTKETTRDKVEKIVLKDKDAYSKFNSKIVECQFNTAENLNIAEHSESSSFTSLSTLMSNHLKTESKEQKFNIPKLFDKSSNISLSTTKQFNSLSDLTQNHLKNNVINKSSIFGKTVKNIPPPTNLNIVSKFSNISLKSKNKNQVKDPDIIDDSEWCIDLSNALKNSRTCTVLPRSKVNHETETFTPRFINCEIVENVEPKQMDLEFCKMDIKDIIFLNTSLDNRVSRFGKVITRTFRRRAPRIKLSCEKENNSNFLFDSPSPDDMILYHLRRN